MEVFDIWLDWWEENEKRDLFEILFISLNEWSEKEKEKCWWKEWFSSIRIVKWKWINISLEKILFNDFLFSLNQCENHFFFFFLKNVKRSSSSLIILLSLLDISFEMHWFLFKSLHLILINWKAHSFFSFIFKEFSGFEETNEEKIDEERWRKEKREKNEFWLDVECYSRRVKQLMDC